MDAASGRGEGRVSQPDASRTAFSTLIDPLVACVVDAELQSVRARERRGLTDREFARIVLLELPRRAHAVVAEADGERRSFLPHLERAVAASPSCWEHERKPTGL